MDLTDMHVKSLKVFLPSPFQGPLSLPLNHKERAMYCIAFLHWPSGTYTCSCREKQEPRSSQSLLLSLHILIKEES